MVALMADSGRKYLSTDMYSSRQGTVALVVMSVVTLCLAIAESNE